MERVWPDGRDGRDDDQRMVAGLPELGEAVAGGLIAALASGTSHIEASQIAERIVALPDLDEAQWRRLARACADNEQVHGGASPSRALQPFFHIHKRNWPPAR